MQRVPMPPSKVQWGEDLDASVSLRPRMGRRLSMDVSEEALAQIGARGLEHATKRLSQEIVHLHAADIQRTIDGLLMDRSWAEPIIEDELRRGVRAFISSLWSDEEKKAQRDWFDVFACELKR